MNSVVFLAGFFTALLIAVGPATLVLAASRRDRERMEHRYATDRRGEP